MNRTEVNDQTEGKEWLLLPMNSRRNVFLNRYEQNKEMMMVKAICLWV